MPTEQQPVLVLSNGSWMLPVGWQQADEKDRPLDNSSWDHIKKGTAKLVPFFDGGYAVDPLKSFISMCEFLNVSMHKTGIHINEALMTARLILVPVATLLFQKNHNLRLGEIHRPANEQKGNEAFLVPSINGGSATFENLRHLAHGKQIF